MEKSYEWMLEMYERQKTDEWYQVWLDAARELEPAFREICDTLSQKQQDQLSDYISACENMESARTLIAYQLGKEHGMRMVIMPKNDK